MSNRLNALLLAVLGVAAPASACGTANDGGLFSPSPGNPTPGADSGLDAGTGSDAAARAPDAGDDAGRPDANPPPPRDSGLPPPVDSGVPPVDSGSTDPGIRCGDGANPQECTVGAQVCCRTAGAASVCETPGACIVGLAIPCDDTQDCIDMGSAGTLCCADLDNQGRASKIGCVKESECTRQQNRTNLCDTAAANPCPNGGSCASSTFTLPGYTICR